MSWDTVVSGLQADVRSLLEQDPDSCIQALAGLQENELQRLSLVLSLAVEFQQQPSQSGLVDSGLQPSRTTGQLQEITSFDTTGSGWQAQGPGEQGSAGHAGVLEAPAGAPEPRAPTVGPAPAVMPGQSQDNQNNNNDPWDGWHPGLLGHDHAPTARASLGPEGVRRADLSSRGLQPGTASGSTGAAGRTASAPQLSAREQQNLTR